MKIRSITVFIPSSWSFEPGQLEKAGKFVAAAQGAFEHAGYAVQTTRLATVPFTELLGDRTADEGVHLFQEIEKATSAAGFEYVSFGPVLPDDLSRYALIPEALAATRSAFFSGLMTRLGGQVSLPAVRLCAQVMHRSAAISPDGFANLRFAALANVPPGAPFFPAAYHQGDSPAFALAMEAAALAVEAFSQAEDLQAASQGLIDRVESHARSLSQVGQALQNQYGFGYGGIDFSMAPFPEPAYSLGEALEQLGVPAVGLHGSMAGAALVASALDQAHFPRAGFNGLFLPVLEDAVLAARAAQGSLTVKDLLLYSAVCGTGLDTVPLPGDTSAEALEAVLLDLAVLAQRLDKPLTARLMPIPGKKAGDPTHFDFAYFANSRVMALDARPLSKKLAGDGAFIVRPRK